LLWLTSEVKREKREGRRVKGRSPHAGKTADNSKIESMDGKR
jgi:hypothetical protein